MDWPEKVNYKLNQDNGVVLVRIAASGSLQLLDKLRRRPPPFVGAVRTSSDATETIFEMAIAKSSRVRHFISGLKLVLDVSQPNGSREIAQLPAQVPMAASNQASIPKQVSDKKDTEKKTKNEDLKLPIQLKPNRKQNSSTDPPPNSKNLNSEKTASADNGESQGQDRSREYCTWR